MPENVANWLAVVRQSQVGVSGLHPRLLRVAQDRWRKEVELDLPGEYNEHMEYRYTEYFENQVLRKRPYLHKEWCIRVIENPLRVERQENNRYRFWGVIEELGNAVLRVVTLDDKRTIHNAFPDRRFKT